MAEIYNISESVAASGDIFFTERDSFIFDSSYSTTNIKGTVDP